MHATMLSVGCCRSFRCCCRLPAPPPDAYVHGAQTTPREARRAGVDRQELGGRGLHPAGRNGQSADVFCGTWQQPSARVRSGGAGQPRRNSRRLATASQWRSGIDTRFRCEPPVATTMLGGNPAELMQCTRLVGGWAHVAMVALVNRHDLVRRWRAAGRAGDGALDRRAGRCDARRRRGTSSGADALLASRLAAKAFSSGDVGQFDTLMAAGTRANLADNPGAAESAFRAALALQQKALGKDNPNTVDRADVAGAAALQRRPLRRGRCAVRRRRPSWRRVRPTPRRRRGCCTTAASMR